MKKPELLAPAGNLTKLQIALEYGADAVYASTGSLSLRQRSAKEFDLATFEEGIKFSTIGVSKLLEPYYHLSRVYRDQFQTSLQ